MKYLKYSIRDESFKEFKKRDLLIRKVNFSAPFEGETEVHKYFNDVYIVVFGKAKVFISDNFSGGKEIDKGEIRGCKMLNYETVDISEGDFLLISANTAHKLVVEEGNFAQFIIKIPEK